MRGVQSRRVRGEQAQLFCTRAHWVMQRFCTILPVYLAHFSRSHDHITRLCNLSALIQQALIKTLDFLAMQDYLCSIQISVTTTSAIPAFETLIRVQSNM